MNEYLNGFVAGFFSAILAIAGLFWYCFCRHGTISADNPRIFLRVAGKKPSFPDGPPLSESLEWLNGVLRRLAADVMSSEYSHSVMQSRLEQLLNSRLHPDFVEPLRLEAVSLAGPPHFGSICSTGRQLVVEATWSTISDDSDEATRCFSLQFASALCYKQLVALPFEACVSIRKLSATVSMILHTHYLELQLSNVIFDVDLESRIGHQVAVDDCAALNNYIKAMLLRLITQNLVDRPAIIPYAKLVAFTIPRYLSPPMSPIPADELFVSNASLPGSFEINNNANI